MLTLSNVRVRNVATVGGALAHGDPHMDLPPVLMALGAKLTVVSPEGRAQRRAGGLLHRLLRDRAGEERADRRGAHPGAGREARRLHEGHHRLGRRLAGARRRGRARRRRQGDQVGPRRGQRRDDEGDAAEVGGGRARRQDASTTSCWRRPATPRSRKPSSSPTCAARCPTSANCCASISGARCGKPSTEAPMMTMTHDAPKVGARSAARCRGSKAATRSPAAPNTPTPCGCRACCTASCSAAPWRTAASSRSTPARRKRCRACCTSSPSTT